MKRKIINSFLILSASSAISKLFSILNRMLLARLLPQEAMTLYLLIMPTLSLCITIGQLGIPSAVFRLVSHPQYNNYKTVISALALSLVSVLIMCAVLIISAPVIAHQLLKNSLTLYPILSFVIFIPLVAVSGILKNFLLAKGHMFAVAKTQIVEETTRLIFIYLLLSQPLFDTHQFLVTIAYLSMSVGEICSIFYMAYKIKRRYDITVSMRYDHLFFKDILQISLPLTGSRLYHCFVSFLEPVTLIYVLTALGFQQSWIQQQYGVISGYIISLLVTPTFFCNIIYRIYLPIATQDLYYKRSSVYDHLFMALGACFAIGMIFTTVFYFFPKQALSLLYNTTAGYQELRYMSIPFLLFYLQTPLSVILQAKNKNKEMFYISVFECTLEMVLTYVLCHRFYMTSILISLFIGILVTLMISALLTWRIIKGAVTK